MGKLILAVISTTMGVFFWYHPVFLPVGKEPVSLAAALWLIALNLILSFTLESSSRGPWQYGLSSLGRVGTGNSRKSPRPIPPEKEQTREKL